MWMMLSAFAKAFGALFPRLPSTIGSEWAYGTHACRGLTVQVHFHGSMHLFAVPG